MLALQARKLKEKYKMVIEKNDLQSNQIAILSKTIE
jgi:hypothetical protein